MAGGQSGARLTKGLSNSFGVGGGDGPDNEQAAMDALVENGVKVAFKDIEYLVPSSKEKGKKTALLKHVGAYLLPSQMTALMGPSGSGKTTLLDLLAGRKTGGETKGEILFAAHKPTQKFLRRYTGYVEQFDTLLGMLTVQEMMMYTAELKRPVSEPYNRKKEAVGAVIEKLALESAKDTRIGNALMKGISGGQAKRVNIGIALVTNPKVLFLDEPTTGLDSYTANEVLMLVKALTSDGITICATVHSPSPCAFALFDRLVMLVRGQLVYFGDRSHAYFQSAVPDKGPRVAMDSGNEAEWITDVIVHVDRMGGGAALAETFNRSTLKGEGQEALEAMMKESAAVSEETLRELSVRRATVTPFWWGLRTLIKYRTTKNYQDPTFLGPRVGDKLVFAFILMSLYWGIGDKLTPDNFINITSCLFMWVTLPAFGAVSYMPGIVLQRPLFIRERNDGLYRVITYFVAKILDELMITLVASAVFGAMVFFPVKLQGSFLLFWCVYFVTLATGVALGYLVAALSPNMDVANAALPAYGMTLLLFSGFLIRATNIPSYWFWYSKLTFVRYAWGAQMVNQWGDADIDCGEEPDNEACIVTGGDGSRMTVLQFYGFDGVNKWEYVGIEGAFFAGFFILAYLVLTLKKYSNR